MEGCENEDKTTNKNELREELKAICKKSPTLLLKRIGELNTSLQCEKDKKEKLIELQDNAIFDESMEGTDIKELEEKLKKQKKKTKNTRDQLHESHNVYEEFGHYHNKNSTSLKKKLILKHLPMKHEHICGGLSGGAFPRLCTSRECNINKHSKS